MCASVNKKVYALRPKSNESPSAAALSEQVAKVIWRRPRRIREGGIGTPQIQSFLDLREFLL